MPQGRRADGALLLLDLIRCLGRHVETRMNQNASVLQQRERTLSTAAGTPLPRVGLGCMGMSEFYGPSDDAQSLRALHIAYDLGYRHFDTADVYGMGHNEQLLAHFLRELGPERRASVYLATKVGIRRMPGTPVKIVADSSPEYVASAYEAGLERR